MNREQILDVLNDLAQSQGFYGRLLRSIAENPEWGNKYLAELEAQNFKSTLDLILYIET